MPKLDKDIALFMLAEKFISQLGMIAKWGFGAWAAVEIIGELAGKETSARFFLSYFGGNTPPDSETSIWLWFLAGVCALWAIFERKLRHQKTEKLQSRITKLEKRLDPDRSTSSLLPTGETNPGDKP